MSVYSKTTEQDPIKYYNMEKRFIITPLDVTKTFQIQFQSKRFRARASLYWYLKQSEIQTHKSHFHTDYTWLFTLILFSLGILSVTQTIKRVKLR